MTSYDDRFFSVRNTTRMALCIALICVSAYIAIPVPFMAPLTMQTFVMCLAALVLTPRIIMGPRGGFFIGFLGAYTLMSLLKGHTPSVPRYAVVGALISVPVTYLFATLWLTILFGDKFVGISAAFMALVQFIPGDLIKAVAAAALGATLNRRLQFL